MASLLIIELHGRLFRELASSTGIRFQGLQQAARRLQTVAGILRLSAGDCEKLTSPQIPCDTLLRLIPCMLQITNTWQPVSLAPSPVIKQVTPALAVPHVAPAPGIEYVSSAHVIEYMAPAPAVTVSVPSQQLPLACSTTTDTTHDNFDITDFVHPQFSLTAVEASSSLAVVSLPIKSIWNRSLQER